LDASLFNSDNSFTQAGFLIGLCSEGLATGKSVTYVPVVWKSVKLKRKVGSTMAAESQVLKEGLGYAIWVSRVLTGILQPEASQNPMQAVRERGITCILDAKSVWDHLTTLTSARSCQDKWVAADVAIIKQALAQAGGRARWAPSALQLADGLTKSEASAHDTLRSVLRSGRYRLADEAEALLERAVEKKRREDLGKARADDDARKKKEAKAVKL
jgi:hypothetical protein